jgi:hypothetical protein
MIPPYESRTHKLLREKQERAAEQAEQGNSSDLEADLEASERRALRLAKELLDEATMRIRAEKSRKEMEEHVEELEEQIAEMESKLDEQSGIPRRISGRNPTGRSKQKPVDSSTKKKEDPTSTSGAEPPVRRSSRVRGGVK